MSRWMKKNFKITMDYNKCYIWWPWQTLCTPVSWLAIGKRQSKLDMIRLSGMVGSWKNSSTPSCITSTAKVTRVWMTTKMIAKDVYLLRRLLYLKMFRFIILVLLLEWPSPTLILPATILHWRQKICNHGAKSAF